jgi:hypothetical protein
VTSLGFIPASLCGGKQKWCNGGGISCHNKQGALFLLGLCMESLLLVEVGRVREASSMSEGALPIGSSRENDQGDRPR